MTTIVFGNRAPWGPDVVRTGTASLVRRIRCWLQRNLFDAWRRRLALDKAEGELMLMGAHMRRDIGVMRERFPRDLRAEPGWL